MKTEEIISKMIEKSHKQVLKGTTVMMPAMSQDSSNKDLSVDKCNVYVVHSKEFRNN